MRYLPLTPSDRQAMLARIGAPSFEALFAAATGQPKAAAAASFGLPNHQGELEVERAFAALATKNLGTASAPSFLGAGAYRHHIPATVDAIIQRGEFLTAYTPYQPEIAQGTLQHLFEFQTQVARVLAMEVANASMWDGATACAEAVLMACRATRRRRVVFSGALHPHFREVSETYARLAQLQVHACVPQPSVEPAAELLPHIDETTACVVVQMPDFFGSLHDLAPVARACHEHGALFVVAFTEVVAFGAVTAPGALDADIVAGEGQSLGVPLSFGGPYLGLLACKQKYVRQAPGRLVGETRDADGRRGYVLTMATREQHIRREKATSNICTNSGLCSLAFAIHLALLGEDGYTRLAALNHEAACALADELATLPGVSVTNRHFFNELLVRLPRAADGVVDALAQRRILGGVPLSRFYPHVEGLRDLLLVAATEMNTADERAALVAALREVLS